MTSIPIVIFHIGNQPYFQKCVSINARNNQVYIIGDDTNKHLFSSNKNVKHFHINDFAKEEVNDFTNSFTNYSTNSANYELNCFLRIFYLKQLLLLTNIPKAFHVDSDCIILDNINEICKNIPNEIAYSLQSHSQKENPFHMVGCIHNGLLNVDFCNTFIQLCFDIYKNKTKFHLIEPKINWHKSKGINGGICDMTIYYLLYSEGLLNNVTDLNDILVVKGEKCTFDHQLIGTYGFMGENTYALQNSIKMIAKSGSKYYFKTVNGDLIRVLSLHFQGRTKPILENIDESTFFNL